ncbi:hypothetical protein ABPG77_008376 [Micractinium sp. CCAP 211/92]
MARFSLCLALLLIAGASCVMAGPNLCRPKCGVALFTGALTCGDACDGFSCEGGTTCKVTSSGPVCVNPCTCKRCQVGQQCAVTLPTCATNGQICRADFPCCKPFVCAGPGAVCFHY